MRRITGAHNYTGARAPSTPWARALPSLVRLGVSYSLVRQELIGRWFRRVWLQTP